MTSHYILVGQSPVPEPNTLAWCEWFQTADRVVAKTDIGGDYVSTIFLGLDHNFSGKGPPILFETMVFEPDPLDKEIPWKSAYMRRCSTWLEAEAQHHRVVKEWRKLEKVSERNG